MSTLAKLNCPSCSSPLEITDDSPTIKCPYCGNTVAIPEELRVKRAAPGGAMAAGAVLAGVAAGNILFEDDFSDRSSGWDTDTQDGVAADYSNGGYRLRVVEEEGDREAVSGGRYKDVSVEVDVAKIRGPNDSAFGIVCRNTDAGTYSFGITADGWYGIYKAAYTEDEDEFEEYALAEARRGDAVKKGDAANHVRADCLGSKLTLHVNGQQVLEVEDPDFDPEYDASGDAGVFAATGDSGKRGLEVVFKNFVVRSA